MQTAYSPGPQINDSHGGQPWYREPWAWGLMLAPGSAVLWGGVMVWLAIVYQDPLLPMDHPGVTAQQAAPASGSPSAPADAPGRQSGSPGH